MLCAPPQLADKSMDIFEGCLASFTRNLHDCFASEKARFHVEPQGLSLRA